MFCLTQDFQQNVLNLFYHLINTKRVKRMAELPKYRMPVGVVTNQMELRVLQRQLLKQQYEKNQNRNIQSQQLGNNKMTSRRYSERNLHNPESISEAMIKNTKDDQFRNILAQNLKKQIQENENKKRMQFLSKLQDQKAINQRSKEQANRDFQASKQIKQRIQFQMMKDYQQKLRRKESQKQYQKLQKQKIKSRLKDIEQASKQKKIRSHNGIVGELSASAKIPQYYQDVANYQQDNYGNFESRVKNLTDSQERKMEHIIEERIVQNKKKQQQFDYYQRKQKQSQRQQLQRILEQQIKQSQKRKMEQKAYDKAKFYGSKFQNVYHPICNPVDSKFCKDNKYIINELYQQGEKKMSRDSQKINRNPSPYDRDSGSGSVLARNGSKSLI